MAAIVARFLLRLAIEQGKLIAFSVGFDASRAAPQIR
jgi:hypothetical protein